MTQAIFEPEKYLTKLPHFGNRDYLEVKWRLLWLRTTYPDAKINTRLVEHEVGTRAVCFAKVELSTGGEATGWGQETAAGFEDYLEKAETKALGRALAALGFGTQFAQDYEDVVVDSPVGATATAQRAPTGEKVKCPTCGEVELTLFQGGNLKGKWAHKGKDNKWHIFDREPQADAGDDDDIPF